MYPMRNYTYWGLMEVIVKKLEIMIMTFERAYNLMKSDKMFEEMFKHQYSPLHVEPIYNENDRFIGYKLRSKEHEKNDEWILDIIKSKKDQNIIIEDKRLLLKDPSKRNEIFVRDACFLCENIFFAVKKGMEIDDKILNIL